MFVTKICTTGVLERTRSHENEKDLNYNERSSLIPDCLVLATQSATKRNDRLGHDRIEERTCEKAIECQGFLYSDETHARCKLLALMKTLTSKEENESKNEKRKI